MKEDKIIVCIDIGTKKVCVVVSKLNSFNKPEVLGIGEVFSYGVRKGNIINPKKTTEAIKEALKKAERISHTNINTVNVNIASEHIQTICSCERIVGDSPKSEITQKDIDRLKDNIYKTSNKLGYEIIHASIYDYIVDDIPVEFPVGTSGTRLKANFHIILAKINNTDKIRKCIQEAGLDINHLILSPYASSSAILTKEEKESGIVLVDIGGGTSDIAIYHDGAVKHTAILPFGGENITSDIKNIFKIPERKAEILKIKHGEFSNYDNEKEVIISIKTLNGSRKEIPVATISKVISDRIKEMIHLIKLEIYKSGYDNKLPAGITLTGGVAETKNICQLFENETAMHTQIGYPDRFLGKTKYEQIRKPLYSTAVGLILNETEDYLKDSLSSEEQYKSRFKILKKNIFKKGKKLKELLTNNWSDVQNY